MPDSLKSSDRLFMLEAVAIPEVSHVRQILPRKPTVLSTWREVGVCGRVSGMSTTSNPYRGFRFPAEIINQAVWLHHCFSLSLQEVELILAARGVVVSYETIREWSRASYEPTPTRSSGADRNPETSGFSMRCLSASEANCTTSGGPLISTGMYSMCWSRADGTRKRPSASFASC